MDQWNEVCANCGLTLGSHRADSHIPNQCPTHEGRMDWPSTGVTVFVPTGAFEDVPTGTPSRREARS